VPGRGADIIVNTDADNQLQRRRHRKLVRPILAGERDFVKIGARPIENIEHFSPIKKVCSGSAAPSYGA